MSILDTIKALFCSKSVTANEAASEPMAAETETVESTPEAAEEKVSAAVIVATTEKLKIPEDSTLKRHFLSALKAEVEAGMPARPTESTLMRHYDATVQSKVENLLA
jgi:Rod binding domain-containing protein